MNEVTVADLGTLACTSIEEVEHKLLQLPQVSCPVHHKFSPGLYIRELFMPAGTLAIGHEQNFAQFNVMLKGRVLMLNADGTTKELVAPLTFTGQQGRKIGYVLEDMVWQNIYPTNETDVETLEKTYLNKSAVWQANQEVQKNLLTLQREVDRQDYKAMLVDLGVSRELVKTQSENEDDMFPISLENRKVCLADSPIHGKGLFATAPIEAGEVILAARLSGKRTQAGRYTNHAKEPNARMVKDAQGDLYLIALKQIQGYHGGDLGEEITVDYRTSVQETNKQVEAVCQA
jgi:hypothetical protein